MCSKFISVFKSEMQEEIEQTVCTCTFLYFCTVQNIYSRDKIFANFIVYPQIENVLFMNFLIS